MCFYYKRINLNLWWSQKVILVRSIYEKKNIAFNFLDSHGIYSIDVVQSKQLSADRRIIGLLNVVQNKSKHL